MENIFAPVIQYFWGSGWDWRLNILTLGTLIAFVIFWLGAREGDSRKTLANWVRRGAWKRLYEGALHRILKTTDRWFLTAKEYDGDNALPLLSPQRAFSGKLLDRAMLLAVLYPFLFLILQWAVTGQAGKIGSLEILPAEPNDLTRFATIGGLVASLLCSYVGATRVKLLWKILWLALAFAFAFAGARAASIAIAGTVAAAFAGAVTIAFAVSLTFVGALAGAGASEVLIAVAVVFGGAFMILEEHKRPTAPRLLVFLCWLILGVTIAVGIGGEFTPDGASLLIMLAALPLINALFDFVSIGVTRYALRHGVRRVSYWTVLYSIGDLIAAAVLFAALGCAVIAFIHLLNSVATAPLMDFAPSAGGAPDGLFQQIAANPQDFWWLYAIFFSTLLPTALHFLIALFAIGPALLVMGGRTWLANWIETSGNHFFKRLASTGALAIWAGISLTLMAAIPHQIFVQLVDDPANWGIALLNFFEGFYCVLPGATCSP